MFSHLFINRLKILLRTKELLFWNLCFPIILATLFYMTLLNITKGEEFNTINIGVVSNESYLEDKSGFKALIEGISNLDDSNKAVFNITIADEEELKNQLDENKINGYINAEGDREIVVKKSGFEETIIKSFLDFYKQRSSTINNLMVINNGQLDISKIEEIASEAKDYLKNISVSDSAPNVAVIYFYTLLAMTCMYSATAGSYEVVSIQANLSPRASRLSLSPINKLKMFLSSIAATLFIQLSILLILFMYLTLVLKIDFGSNYLLVFGTGVIGTITGLLFGTCLSSMLKISGGAKVGIISSVNMLFSFLAGMMSVQMKYIVQENAPILAKINPINLITDAFYSLYYYDTYDRFIGNIVGLCIMSFIFLVVTYLVLRRQQYDSI